MCGIFCTIIHNRNTFLNEIAKKGDFKNSNPLFSEFYDAFKNRGPDYYKEQIIEVSPYTLIQCAGCLLWTQGTAPVPQPFSEEDGNVLLWNGDIFSGPLATTGNDTKILYEKLSETSKEEGSVAEVFASVRGPYSFIYYEKKNKTLYFGRDTIGRHSLLIGISQRSVTISSVACKNVEGFTEVPAVGIFAYNLQKDGEMQLTLYPWSHVSENLLDFPHPLLKQSQIGNVIQTYLKPPRRGNKTPLASELEMWSVQDQDYSLEELMGKLTVTDSKTKIKKTMSSLIAKPTIQILVQDLFNTLKESVRLRVEKQPQLCKNCMKMKLNGPDKNVTCSHARVAILFSGGLDSAVLASLAHKCLPPEEPIDLLNVAFEKPTKCPDVKQSIRSLTKDLGGEISYNVPDRITGLGTLEELKEIHADRKWNFVKKIGISSKKLRMLEGIYDEVKCQVKTNQYTITEAFEVYKEVNITQEELQSEREKVISHLIYPLKTVLDDSLGCALWFASRGKGLLHDSNELYISPSRVILSGIGADEQLGGYMRHRSTLKHRGGWEALDKELQYELKRISHRNLGRDDRVASDHGRQLRMPFLDEDVVNYLSFISPWNRCFPVDSMPPGLGDKLLLRLTAWELGFRQAANLPKRAMQFGSRIANSREKGSDFSDRL